MRRVARYLGRAPMSLYRHIDDVDQLRQMVVEALIDRIQVTDHGADWRRTLTEGSDALRDLFGADPGILTVIMRSGLTTPSMLRILDTLMGALRIAGLNLADVARAEAALMALVFGSAVLRRSIEEVFPGIEADPEVHRRFVQHLLPDDDRAYPNLQAVAPVWARTGHDRPFRFAMDRLLDGIETLGSR